jgi:hypothetical protein
VAALLAGCSTLNYRDVQADFNTAVQADNVRTAEALGALTSSGSDAIYESIRVRLTDENIRALDERLRPNAYAIRGVAEWRSGKLAEARATAQAGLKLPNVASSPRDEMVLEIIPAVVIDEELVTAFKQAGRKVSKSAYDERYARDFATAVEILRKVSANVRPSAPDAIRYYVYLQQWRILQNWRFVINHIEDGADAQEAASRAAALRLGVTSLADDAQRTLERVPPGEPIRKAMEALALR